MEINTKNPFEQTVEEQITALRAQNVAGNWGISEEDFIRLVRTAPAWPSGKDAFRSFRIRWGEGGEGVALTYRRHVDAVMRVYCPNNWRWRSHPSYGRTEHLQLLHGNDSHVAVVEWVIISDLSENLERTSINSVRSAKSLADEGLVLVWLCPKRAFAPSTLQSNGKWFRPPAWFCAGYTWTDPRYGVEERVIVRTEINHARHDTVYGIEFSCCTWPWEEQGVGPSLSVPTFK